MKDPREMETGELKSWLADRLRMRGRASGDLDRRRDEAPYDYPLELWRTAEAPFHYEFLRAIIALVDEATTEPWEPKAFDQLVRLIEAGRIGEATNALEPIARRGQLLASEQGSQLHMQTLRTLLALGWTGSLEFWLAQRAIVGARWPGLIFKGLARHSLDFAFAQLPLIAIDAKAMRQVLDLLPGLMRDQNLGLSHLQRLFCSVTAHLHPDSAELLREWFVLRGMTPPLTINTVHATLIEALAHELDNQAVPRTYHAALVEDSEHELLTA
jgi:hypothetical protein